ncbi:ABC transporter permease [Flammeovirgaceae bacterium SG7u.111]|nr:ABC transporter permease [Flammeovirgaceae bacterium SG7u.132]WPO33668.1 ABC transporter permease [Flammeovirgaceae bacterium SG7u.111]
MFKNLLKTAIRSLLKNKAYSAINLIGLTIGIASSTLLFFYVLDEVSFDRFHGNHEKIYRVVSHISEPDKSFSWGSTQAPTGPQLMEDYPLVENYVRFFGMGRVLFQNGDTRLYQEDVIAVDSTIFEVFDFKLIEGDPATALGEPNSIVLTEEVAAKYFGSESPVGKILSMQDNTSLKVTGVVEDVPRNSHIDFAALMSLNDDQKTSDNWGSFYLSTYLVIPTPEKAAELKSLLPEMYEKYMAEIFKRMNIDIQYDLQPLASIHLYSNMEGENGGNILYVYIMAIVAVFMLVIAGINYMNLATARSASRAKEVGVRKVMGSRRGQLIAQFLTESIVLSFVALLLSLLVVVSLLPFFNDVAGKQIGMEVLGSPMVLIVLLLITLITGLLGGSYPALVLSKFQPIMVLKGKVVSGKNNALFRKVLVVLQFSISMFMLICTWIVFDQLSFMQDKDLGYDKEQVMTVSLPREQEERAKFSVLRNKLIQNEEIINAATAWGRTSSIGGRQIFTVETATGMEEKAFRPFRIDHNFLNTMGMELVEGRGFSLDYPADTLNSVLINEETARRMSWEEPLGKKVQLGGRGEEDEEPQYAEVVGVIKDFHQQSLHSKIEPMILMYGTNDRVVHIKMNTGDIRETVDLIKSAWGEVFPTRPFEYDFLDQNFADAYEEDARRGTIFTTFSGLTILIACLGLLGLASFSAEQRTKEIGIRKVIGASVPSIVVLISKDFIYLIGVAILISFPVSWYFMSDWLQAFAYQTEIKWTTFVASAFLTILITFLTVSYHTIKAATANPVKSLKDE